MPAARLRRLAASRTARDVSPRGLTALAIIVNDVLATWGTQPAFASLPVAQRPARPLLTSTVETPTEQLQSRSSSPRAAAAPTADHGLPIDDRSGDGLAADMIEADHAETWHLVRLAQGGDGEAFGALYDRYVDVVFRFIYYRVNDRALAEDFTSETFLRALRRIGSISYQGRDIGAWLVTIARNIVLDHLKSARNRLETTTADTIEGREYERSTEAAVLDTLQSEQLMKAINELGDEQRECIMLRFIQGQSVSETAAIMGKNEGAIKALQHRAVRKLADLVGGDLR